jgi:hypothetical protein
VYKYTYYVYTVYRIHWHLCTRLGTNHITAEYCISLFLISEHQSPITKRFEFDSGADLFTPPEKRVIFPGTPPVLVEELSLGSVYQHLLLI